jgi:hypothetical protein
MGKVPFLFPDVEVEFTKGFSKAIDSNFRMFSEQYMSPDNVLKFNHGRMWEAPANASGDTMGEMSEHGTETKLSLKDIAEGNVESIFRAISQVTDDIKTQVERQLFDIITTSTEKSGNVVNGSQKTFPQSMYEMLEMMQLPLDDAGELSMPTMFIHPSQTAKLKAELDSAGKEFGERFEALKEKKKAEAQERERQRLARFERPET